MHTKYEQMKPFDKQDEFRKGMLKLLLTFIITLENDYIELFELEENLASSKNKDEAELYISLTDYILCFIEEKFKNSTNEFKKTQ